MSAFPEGAEIVAEKIKEFTADEVAHKEWLVSLIGQPLTPEWGIQIDEITRMLEKDGNLTHLGWIRKRQGALRRMASLYVEKDNPGKTDPGKITAAMISQAKSIPLESVMDFPLKRNGQRLLGLCPFHEAHSPSFYIYPETNTYSCFGCGAGGDPINFIKKRDGRTFANSVRFLLGISGWPQSAQSPIDASHLGASPRERLQEAVLELAEWAEGQGYNSRTYDRALKFCPDINQKINNANDSLDTRFLATFKEPDKPVHNETWDAFYAINIGPIKNLYVELIKATGGGIDGFY